MVGMHSVEDGGRGELVYRCLTGEMQGGVWVLKRVFVRTYRTSNRLWDGGVVCFSTYAPFFMFWSYLGDWHTQALSNGKHSSQVVCVHHRYEDCEPAE